MSVESIESKKNKFELFKEKISELVEAEKEKMRLGKEYNSHLVEIDAEELNEEDMEIYERFKNRTLTFGDFSKFRKDVVSRIEKKGIQPAAAITEEEMAVYERFKKGEITRDEFLDYWEKAVPNKEFWEYWRKMIAGREEKDFLYNSEENFYGYLDNEIEGDRFWYGKFAEETGKEKQDEKGKNLAA